MDETDGGLECLVLMATGRRGESRGSFIKIRDVPLILRDQQGPFQSGMLWDPDHLRTEVESQLISSHVGPSLFCLIS